MEANELRIGNYILKSLKSGNGRKINDKIGVQDIVRIYENTGSFNYESIPLTEEWLLKFGFKIIDDNPKQKPQYKGDIIFKILDFEFSNSDKSNNNNGFYCYEINNGDTIINYVNQLQNLYFALTGEELLITNTNNL